jgi:hypothetical protein
VTRLLVCLVCIAVPAGAAPPRVPKPPGQARACAPPPALALSPGFHDPRRIFAPAGRSFRTLETRFASAYGLACRRRLLNAPFPGGRLLLRNAPDANTTSIYRDGEDRARAMVIEHPFIGQGGRVDIPSVEELRSAIICSAHNASPSGGPVGDILECLPD